MIANITFSKTAITSGDKYEPLQEKKLNIIDQRNFFFHQAVKSQTNISVPSFR